MFKNFCTTHHFYYTGHVCPLCEKERIDKMAKRFSGKEKQEVKEEEVTDDMLQLLVNRFNK